MCDEINFSLNASDQFANRSKDIFTCLDSLEASHKEFLKKPNIVQDCKNVMKSDPVENKFQNPAVPPTVHSPNQEFKVPTTRPPKSSLNFKDSTKWTKYSLTDVGPDQMNESSNRKTAFDFLDSQIIKNDEVKELESEIPKKHIFKKPCKQKDENVDQNHLSCSVLRVKYEEEERKEEEREQFIGDDKETFIKKTKFKRKSRVVEDDEEETETEKDKEKEKKSKMLGEKNDKSDEDDFSDLKKDKDSSEEEK